ncbi:Acyltransferase [Sulfidibacter corallicola]|uniref:Acyltransferase n=1 Tax=Sulfidibacter corallicola TaxID=2818388 RepID=A0A8A4TJN7_SULCO|nr:acyltransferase [Sulfidibacter corallicola]QTD49697.1 acyltransferase [Sulfidibacter corallicola]
MSDPATSLYADYRAKRYFGSLDGFRALSIIAVIWHHTGGDIVGNGIPMLKLGFLGVDMFFVISGFLIVTLLLRERDRTGGISLKGFYLRRTLRIFPIYYGIMAALAALFLFVRSGSPMAQAFWQELPYYLTYTSNWTHTAVFAVAWSLACEEQFYLIYPPIEKFLRKWVLPAIVAFIFVNQLANFGILDPFFESLLGTAELEVLQATFTPICLGVVVAHVLHHKSGFDALARIFGHPFMPLVCGGVLLVSLNLPFDDISGLPRLLTQLIMTGLLLSCVMREDHVIDRPMRSFFFKRIGLVSYGMYLYHMFVREAMSRGLPQNLFDQPLLRFGLCLVVTWVIAEVSFKLVESPILAYKDRLKHRAEAKLAAERN